MWLFICVIIGGFLQNTFSLVKKTHLMAFVARETAFCFHTLVTIIHGVSKKTHKL